MAIIKCKMCGGDLDFRPGETVAECEYCGTLQTVPSGDNEKKLTFFARANRLRAACEFDTAAAIYEQIIAEFPSEAEAYWGLVLCKYGIEYVDDPATGKKIPTCHRLSYDSVLDDANLELAMDYADTAARRVYREEARHLEKLRTGILEVSSQEKPYDIFLCYKETDENGDRTLDSVLAQNLYTALTERGYRVFFSRITLQSKLGEAYEPYIFAALNSAKVMLAIGTDPEYYSAVWVKNEWSRYLKICAEDKTRHLIPCYKDMDAYDLPREFRPLQGVDLGKMGADQDILFNMEKYIPLQKKVLVQEKVVVGGTGGSNKIASLLDRGNMALEDGDWAKADSFFEDVLNNDSKNAQAYIGKTLAQEKCRTMDALVRKRRDAHQNVAAETLYIKEKTAHISEKAEQYALPGYVEQQTIRERYGFNLSYTSEVSGWQRQCREEESWWQNHRLLSRAEKFAAGAVAEHLQSEKKHLFAQLADRVKKAQEADARSVSRLEAAYDAHIAEGDRRAEAIYNDGLARRKKDYETWLAQAKKETDPDALKKLAQNFAALGDYQDSKNLAEHCRKRAAEEQAQRDAEAERQKVIAERKRKSRNRTVAILSAIAVVLVIAIALFATKVIIPSNKYKAAEALLEEGKTAKAAIAFVTLGDYKDARERGLALWDVAAERETISAGMYHTVGLKEDGTVVATKYSGEDDYGQCDVSDWTDIVAISAGYMHTVGLKSDGTVVATKYSGEYDFNACDVSDWTDIVAISAGSYHTVGLKSDGTVVATKCSGVACDGQCKVADWTDIVAISAGDHHTVGLKSDGTVVATKCTGEFCEGQCNVSDWTDIEAISAGYLHTAGLKSDGTVVTVGYGQYGQIIGWTDIVAISAGSFRTVGLKSDGTVVSVEVNDDDLRELTGGWTDIVAISARHYHAVGLKSDGTVVAAGWNDDGQCNVSSWKNIKLPNK